jgi:hypothetical protein
MATATECAVFGRITRLFVPMRELLVEVEQIFDGRDAVVLAPHQ